MNINTSANANIDTSKLNHPRRGVIDRTTIIYGRTPQGIQRKQLNEMAASMNTDLKSLCQIIISLSEEERFQLLRKHHKEQSSLLGHFFNDFQNYKPEEKLVQLHNLPSTSGSGSHKSPREIYKRKMISNSGEFSGHIDHSDSKVARSNNQLTPLYNKDRSNVDSHVQRNRIADPCNSRTTHIKNNPPSCNLNHVNSPKGNSNSHAQRNRIDDPCNSRTTHIKTKTPSCNIDHISLTSGNSRLQEPSNSKERKEQDKPPMNTYDSIAATILFSETDLKEDIQKRIKPKTSPIKRNTILETLFF